LSFLAASCALGSTADAAATLKPPVIPERFTPLPCNMNTTIGMEGCAESKLLRDDKLLNEQVVIIFDLFHGTSQKRDFVNAENFWLTYRGADCQSFAEVFEGGSIAPVEYANCEVHDDTSRSADLHSLFTELTEGDNTNIPPWP
jgi:uncharacterized protein YecT (DUF1311 family)